MAPMTIAVSSGSRRVAQDSVCEQCAGARMIEPAYDVADIMR